MAEPVQQFNIHEAKTQLSRILERVEDGAEVVISRAGHPVAKVVPLQRGTHRTGRGSLRDQLTYAPGSARESGSDSSTKAIHPPSRTDYSLELVQRPRDLTRLCRQPGRPHGCLLARLRKLGSATHCATLAAVTAG